MKMKKLFTLLAIAGLMTFGANVSNAGSTVDTNQVAEANNDTSEMEESPAVAPVIKVDKEEIKTKKEETKEASQDIHQTLKEKFIEGGPGFMSFVLIALILGLALCIERIIYLNMSSTNKEKFVDQIEDALQNGGVEAAKEVCRNTRGPIASIFYQGLDRTSEGLDVVEKSVVAYGSVQMGRLEKNLSWIALFIALAPMLGFLGTVIGMIEAFDKIASEGAVSPTTVASGIKKALITTVSGLVVAIILQVFYNYIVSKIDAIVNDMEDASISLIDMLIKNDVVKS